MKVNSAEELIELGQKLGSDLRGGEVIELVGDVGAGKTTLTQGIACGLGIEGTIGSPSFTIMNSYHGRDGLTMNHYDFYRLDDPGIMREEIAESLSDPTTITIIEWADSIKGVLPNERKIVHINYLPNSEGREVIWSWH